jgi:hypothetical protein
MRSAVHPVPRMRVLLTRRTTSNFVPLFLRTISPRKVLSLFDSLRAQPTGFRIEAAFSEAIRAAREQKSVSLLKRAEASHADCRR